MAFFYQLPSLATKLGPCYHCIIDYEQSVD